MNTPTPQCATATDRALAQLPTDALRAEAEQLAWHIFQTTDMDLYAATVEAVASIADVLDYAADWDAAIPCRWCGGTSYKSAMQPAFCGACVEAMLRGDGSDQARKDMHRAPEPPTPTDAAGRKAAWYAAQGVRPVAQRGGFLVPSGTRAGVVHFVAEGRCTCEAGQHGRRCWHTALVAMQTERKGAA